jgi:hypothetical protein
MSYQKFLHKYLYLKEEIKDLKEQEKINFNKFNKYFSVKEEKGEKENPTLQNQEPSPKRIPDNPSKPIYKELSKILHPDKGGDNDEFALVSSLYREKDTIGLCIKAEENGIDIKPYITKELEETFEGSCEVVEDEIEKIKGTISWVWCNADNELEKDIHLAWIKKNLGLSPKKD